MLDLDEVKRQVEAFFSSPAWKPRDGETVTKIELSDNCKPQMLSVYFENTDSLYICCKGVGVCKYTTSDSMKSYALWTADRPVDTVVDAIKLMKKGLAKWQKERAGFFDECLDALESSGMNRAEAMRLNALVFGDYKGTHS